MWKFFKSRDNTGQADANGESFCIKPDLAQLNNNCFACNSCQALLSLPDYTGLSIVDCLKCGSKIFVPYLLKKYWLYLPLGGGGMGSVYRAMDRNAPDREYAVKVLPREKRHNPRLIEALLTEATIARGFGRHPHLGYVEDFGDDRDEFFSAMEFIEGQRLDQIIESPDDVDEKYVLLWGLQILSAEQHMYDCGYLYRDLKPQNIIIDPEGNARLFDFGLCLPVAEARQGNASGKAPGSPIYMPPERIVGEPEDMSGEIYSLGMVMFHALTKSPYYNADGAMELAKKHVVGLRMASVAKRLPPGTNPDIAPIIDRMIERLPEDRYQNYKEVGAAIYQVYNNL